MRESIVAGDREHSQLAGIELAANFLQLADADVECVIEDVDEHVATTVERHDRGRHGGFPLQLLQRLAFERCRVGGPPSCADRLRAAAMMSPSVLNFESAAV